MFNNYSLLKFFSASLAGSAIFYSVVLPVRIVGRLSAYSAKVVALVFRFEFLNILGAENDFFFPGILTIKLYTFV